MFLPTAIDTCDSVLVHSHLAYIYIDKKLFSITRKLICSFLTFSFKLRTGRNTSHSTAVKTRKLEMFLSAVTVICIHIYPSTSMFLVFQGKVSKASSILV